MRVTDGGSSEPDGAAIVRSQLSRDFEQLWRTLPRNGGQIPERTAFKPRTAKAFLRHVMIAQAPTADNPTLRVRLVGEAIRQQVGRDIVGDDFIEFMGEERRAGVLEIVSSMFKQSHGVWWVAPVHYERGFSQFWEVTAFPLGGSERAPAAIVALVRPAESLLDLRAVNEKAVRVDLTVQFLALDRDF